MCSKSLISEEILMFYCQNLNNSVSDGRQYFNNDCTLQFKKIYVNLLSRVFKKTKDLSYDDYLHCYDILKPVFKASQAVINETDTKTLSLSWLRINMNHDMWCNKPEETILTENVEKILLLTAMLEYGLGSIYYTLSEKTIPPHLLRDLLSSSELLEFFGHEIITFLRILLGTPKSINLRNIVWHGFPKPLDVPSYYVSILLLIIHTLGDIVKEKTLKIIYRPQVEDFEEHVTEITRNLPSKLLTKTAEMELIAENCSLIAEDYKTYWSRIYQLYKDDNYWNCILLILPQIELILRLKYSEVNDFDVSAKLDEHYITMDTIFEPELPYKSVGSNINRLISSESGLKEGSLKLLYDLFVAPNGPRLRDKVSHGEVTIESLNNRKLCEILLCLSLHLLHADHTKFSLFYYESKFHLNCRTQIALSKVKISLQNFAQLHLRIGNLIQSNENEAESTDIKIFQRPKKESVYMLLLFKTANSVTKTCENYEDSISSCQSLLKQRELRSRRRRTLVSLLEALPKIYDCLCSILDCLVETFKSLQATDSDIDMEDNGRLLKALKRTLKITENLVKYSSVTSNEWIKAVELCDSFQKIREKLSHMEKKR